MPSQAAVGQGLARIRQAADAGQIEVTATSHRSGSLVLLPLLVEGTNLRIRWDRKRASIIEQGHVEVSWSVHDRAFGSITGSEVIDHTTTEIAIGNVGTARVSVEPFTSARALSHQIDQLRADAHAARFSLLTALEPFVKSRAQHSSIQISKELAALDGIDLDRTGSDIGAVDDIDQDAIVTEVLFGNEDDPTPTSIAIRILERAAGDLDAKVGDTRTYLTMNLKSAVETAVRRAIGDPHIGRNVRAMAIQMGTRDPEVLLEAMRRHLPGAPIGAARIQAALNARPSPHVNRLSLDFTQQGSDTTFAELSELVAS